MKGRIRDGFKNHFIQSLQDGRSAWITGKQIDVTKNESFQGTLATITHFEKYFKETNIPTNQKTKLLKRDMIGSPLGSWYELYV
ncbi:hypothetical protein P5763_12265 [Bacillus cereus]|nr:hypothetical protein [Bacillus cereus]